MRFISRGRQLSLRNNRCLLRPINMNTEPDPKGLLRELSCYLKSNISIDLMPMMVILYGVAGKIGAK